jgi:hypothetical protein
VQHRYNFAAILTNDHDDIASPAQLGGIGPISEKFGRTPFADAIGATPVSRVQIKISVTQYEFDCGRSNSPLLCSPHRVGRETGLGIIDRSPLK